jgi:fumarate hydratase class II
MSEKEYRVENDSMGEIKVPADKHWGAQTQRAIENFKISGITMPPEFMQALGLLKWAVASANSDLGLLAKDKSEAIGNSALEIAKGGHSEEFPVDVFQTGSATSTNMNINEVIANLASTKSLDIHPNDDVNMGQSSNDVIPSTIHIAATIAVRKNLLDALSHLQETLENKATSLSDIVKTGRTHLMDAMPVTFGQELSAWANQIKAVAGQFDETLPKMEQLAIGGTAVGTGVNAHPDLAKTVIALLRQKTDIEFKSAPDLFMAMSFQDIALELSSNTRSLAVALTKISNDLRWMNSGPLAGLAEISLPMLQPGSSIMPGKVNPVIPESVAMVSAQVIGNDATISLAAQSGNFQLNTMLPLIAYNLLQSISLLSNASSALADKAIKDFSVNQEKIDSVINRNPVLATALNSVIGYELGTQIVKKAYADKRAIIEVALEMTELDEGKLKELLDPFHLTSNNS